MHGLHLTADLRQCKAGLPAMTDPSSLRQLCLSVVEQAGLLAVGELFHGFGSAAPLEPDRLVQGGVTGVVLLAESHLAVHTWPELLGVTLDVYVCNVGCDNSAKAHRMLNELIAAFSPKMVDRHTIERGLSSNCLEGAA